MNISLTPNLESLVKTKIESGLYNSASDVIRVALRLLEERDQLREIRINELKQEIQKGLDSGISTPLNIEDIKTRGRQRLTANAQDL